MSTSVQTAKTSSDFLTAYCRSAGLDLCVTPVTNPFDHLYICRTHMVYRDAYIYGFGASGMSESIAEIKSIAEALERFSLMQTRKDVSLRRHISVPGVGVGFHLHKEAAKLQSMYELIERDACMTAYLLRAPVPHIRIETITDRPIRQLQKDVGKKRLHIDLFDITNDHNIPTYLSILTDTSGNGPAVSTGIKAGSNIIETILSSMEEAMMVYATYKNLKTEKILLGKTSTIRTPLQRSRYWSFPGMIRKLSFWFDQPRIPFPQPALPSAKRVSKLSIYDITPRVIRDSGYHVFQAASTELQPYYTDEKNRIVNKRRIASLRGFFRIRKQRKLNTIPHPFI